MLYEIWCAYRQKKYQTGFPNAYLNVIKKLLFFQEVLFYGFFSLYN